MADKTTTTITGTRDDEELPRCLKTSFLNKEAQKSFYPNYSLYTGHLHNILAPFGAMKLKFAMMSRIISSNIYSLTLPKWHISKN